MREPTPNNSQGEPAKMEHIPFRRIIQNRHLWTLIILFLLTEFFFYTWTGWVPALLMLKGATAESAGLLTSIAMWVAIPGCLLMPHISNKVGLRKPFIWGSALIPRPGCLDNKGPPSVYGLATNGAVRSFRPHQVHNPPRCTGRANVGKRDR